MDPQWKMYADTHKIEMREVQEGKTWNTSDSVIEVFLKSTKEKHKGQF